ncbi:hypothetical protein B0O80DRAFT_499433 [Mortierella sp. GBAus27b]|nr:hypothetical protein BGX31_005894 [Mortierella sp. GBA43]KAI8352743.1 hypothetical protein B0O80DRAFT_499433 [Mortierella sp. GBAus27b]
MTSLQSADSQPPPATLVAAQDVQGLDPPGQQQPLVTPSEFVYQLILEQFWGDGVSKREIRAVYTTPHDANNACHDYLLRTWTKDQFSLFEVGLSPQRPELSKVSALINGDRFHVWIEKHPWVGTLDFSSKAIAQRAGKGPNAYILQRTIKDAAGGKRRSTTRGIFATRQLAKQALTVDELPSEWSSNQGYIVEPGGEYAHALSPSGKTAWLFIEVRPLYMSYTRLDQELQEAIDSSANAGSSAQNPISLEGDDTPSIPPSPTLMSRPTHLSAPISRSSLDNPFSPLPSNPDEAGAFVYLVLQLKTLLYTPPILTVEAVAYEIEVANRFGIAILEGFSSPESMFEPGFREDGCLQGTIELRSRDEGLTVWVEKRSVILGEDALDFDLISEHGSVQLNRALSDPGRPASLTPITAAAPEMEDHDFGQEDASKVAVTRGQKRVEPEDGFETAAARSQSHSTKSACVSRVAEDSSARTDARYKIVSVVYRPKPNSKNDSASAPIDSSDDSAVAIIRARVLFYGLLTNTDITTMEIVDHLENSRTIQARSRSDPSLVLHEIRVQDTGTE